MAARRALPCGVGRVGREGRISGVSAKVGFGRSKPSARAHVTLGTDTNTTCICLPPPTLIEHVLHVTQVATGQALNRGSMIPVPRCLMSTALYAQL